MVTVTSAEKNRIEGQMKTALPYINEQVDFKLEIETGMKGRSRLTFKQEEESYALPIFYITPSTDDSAWELLTDHIEEQNDSQGIFIIKFHSEQHQIQNATTYALNNHELYQKNVLSEMCRLCSYIDLEPYKVQLFDVQDVKRLFEKISNQSETIETVEDVQEVPDVAANEESKTPMAAAAKEEAPVKIVAKAPVQMEEKAAQPKEKTEENSKLDSDIKALIQDCFGIF